MSYIVVAEVPVRAAFEDSRLPAKVPTIIVMVPGYVRAVGFMTLRVASKQASAEVVMTTGVHIDGAIACSGNRAAVDDVVVAAPNLDALAGTIANAYVPDNKIVAVNFKGPILSTIEKRNTRRRCCFTCNGCQRFGCNRSCQGDTAANLELNHMLGRTALL